MATKERLLIERFLKITNKDRENVPFILNSAQARLDEHLTGRDIIPKSRQRGISSYYLARYFMKCISEENTRAVVISHDAESTQRMLARVRFFMNNMRGPKPVVKDDNKNEITFPKMNSAFYIGTAGSRKFGRGDTITHLHCSEVAYWPNPKDLLAGLFQAVPKRSGEIGIESTGNGTGNWYHRACVRALEGRGMYRLHFISWLDDPDCYIPVTTEEAKQIMENLDPELEEPELVETHGLNAGQIQFRRMTLEEMDFDINLFKQEYPATFDDCFRAKGSSIFGRVLYEPTDEWQQVERNMYALHEIYKSPPGKYVIGADVGGGLGGDKDNSVADIIDLDNKEQIAQWASNRYDPAEFAHELARLGKHFNDAYIAVESNNHGAVTLLKLREIYPNHLIYSSRTDSDHLLHMGYRTTSKTRPIMIGQLKAALAFDLTIHSPLTKGELDNFVESENGKLEAAEGCHDDRVISLAVANMAYEGACLLLAPYSQEQARQRAEDVDPFSLEGMIARVQRKQQSGHYPIPDQAGSYDGYFNIH